MVVSEEHGVDNVINDIIDNDNDKHNSGNVTEEDIIFFAVVQNPLNRFVDSFIERCIKYDRSNQRILLILLNSLN